MVLPAVTARGEAEAAREEAAQANTRADEAESALEAAEEEPPQRDSPPASEAPDEEDVDGVLVRVTGNEPFSGNYGNIDSTRSVDGSAPEEYEVEVDTGFFSVDSVVAVMQKNNAGSGELGVEIVVDGEVVEETSTTAEYGVAEVSWSPAD